VDQVALLVELEHLRRSVRALAMEVALLHVYVNSHCSQTPFGDVRTAPAGWGPPGGQSASGTWTVLVWRNSRRPSSPPSRPTPLLLYPPNGNVGGTVDMPLIPTAPDSSSRAMRWARLRSSVKT